MYPGPLPLHPNLPDVLGLTPRAADRPRRSPRRHAPVPTIDGPVPPPRSVSPRGEAA
jgi:hypothetical protein